MQLPITFLGAVAVATKTLLTETRFQKQQQTCWLIVVLTVQVQWSCVRSSSTAPAVTGFQSWSDKPNCRRNKLSQWAKEWPNQYFPLKTKLKSLGSLFKGLDLVSIYHLLKQMPISDLSLYFSWGRHIVPISRESIDQKICLSFLLSFLHSLQAPRLSLKNPM